jgi:hypothetical protein
VATALGGVTELPPVFCTGGHGGGPTRPSVQTRMTEDFALNR